MKILLVLCCALLSGCGAKYAYMHTNKDGSSCQLDIWSARDIQAGDLHISPTCGLDGGADSMASNEKAIEAMNNLISKIP